MTDDPGMKDMLSVNLLTNALTHGGADRPVQARAGVEDAGLVISMTTSSGTFIATGR